MKLLALILPLAAALAQQPAAQRKVELLWTAGAPGALGTDDADKPSLTLYPVSEAAASKTAVIVCPGGGYGSLAKDHEGDQIARWLNSLGVSAFLLQYRIAPRYHYPAPVLDAQRAIRFVRAHAAEYHILPDRIRVLLQRRCHLCLKPPRANGIDSDVFLREFQCGRARETQHSRFAR